MLTDHPELQKTSYTNNIMLLYQSTTVTYMQSYISSDNRFLSLHLVLETPLLYDNYNFRLYKVEKVPLLINNTFIFIDIPKYVYAKKDKFLLMELDDRSCIIGNLISTCDDMFPQNNTYFKVT